jgi:hypothetical protein
LPEEKEASLRAVSDGWLKSVPEKEDRRESEPEEE